MRTWLTALALLIMSPAHAEENPEKLAREVRAGWLVLPPAELPPEATVHTGELVIRQRLVPIGYSTVDVNASDDTGAVIVPAGTNMIRLIANTGIFECAIATENKGLSAFLVGGSIHICLQDKDKDGFFESYARYKGNVQGLPSMNGRLPKTLRALKAPVAYTNHDPRTLPTDYFIGIRYDGKSSLSGMPIFVDVFGSGKDVGSLDHAWPRADGGTGKLQATGRVLLKGAVFDVVANEADALTVRVMTPFPPGVFSISQFSGPNGFW